MNNLKNKIISIAIITLWLARWGILALIVGWTIPTIMGNTTWALPQDGTVAAGSSTITKPDANTMRINQTTDKSIINWQGYSIGANEKVQYFQPNTNSISLNRVTGADPSLIYGQLSANGQVWVINPNGLLVGQNAKINVGGFLASTLNITDDNFINGNYNFSAAARQSGNSITSIVNQGNINAADGGYVVLISPSINNSGNITANNGSVNMASGDDITLTFANNGLINLIINKQTAAEALGIDNSGTITADGGQVIISAQTAGDLLKTVINNTGVIQARTISNKNGTIKLLGGMENNAINVGGTLDASAPNGGDGGFIETSAASVKVADSAIITTAASNGKTGTWLIDPQDYTIAASGGDITGAALSTNLGSSNVTILSSSGAGGISGNVNVNDTVTWSLNKLTLNAQNNININATMNASGTASLALEYGQGAVAAGNTATYNIHAPVNLASTGSFSTKLGSDGTPINYTIITSLGAAGSVTGTDLQGMSGNLVGKYALGSNIDATTTSTWNTGAGFAPVGGTSSFPFAGRFNGLGHTITGLTINRPTTNYIGLFGYTNGAAVSNVGLVGGSVTGSSYVGGLAGVNIFSTISNSYSTGSVTGNASNVGGLVGNNGGTISNSYSTGSVSSTSLYVGGLAGINTGTISNSYSTDSVSSTGDFVGGLVGQNWGGIISNSYATGSVSGNSDVGGLVGYSWSGTISNSYATGSVTGSNLEVGGLVGGNVGTISNSYSTGSASNTGAISDFIGGLVGTNSGTIANSYSTGSVTGGNIGSFYIGGLAGDNGGTITNSYWDTQTSGRANCTGFGSSAGCTGLTTAQMTQQANFTGWDFTNTWRMYAGHTYPLLKSFLTPLTITANAASKTYDGLAYSGGNGVTYSSAPNANLLGTVSYSGTSQGATNAGSYAITPGGFYSNQQGYDITFANGALTINPAPLTVTGAVANNKIYDGTTTATLSNNGTLSGLVGAETLTLNTPASVAFADKNAALGKTVTASGYTIANGTGLASNYQLTSTSATTTANITPAPLTITANAATKTYNGLAYSGGNGVGYTGFVNGETSAVLGGALTYGGTSQGATNAGSYVITPSGQTSGNYTITYNNGALTVNPAALTVTANTASKTYNGLAYSGGNGVTYTGLVNGETSAVLGGALAYGGTSQGAINAGSYVITPSGLTSGNYNIAYVNGALTITSAPTPAPTPTTSATTSIAPIAAMPVVDYTNVIQEGIGNFSGNIGTGQTKQPAKYGTASAPAESLETFTFTSADNSRPLIIDYQLRDSKQRRCLSIRRN